MGGPVVVVLSAEEYKRLKSIEPGKLGYENGRDCTV